jgi:hypothetical protein
MKIEPKNNCPLDGFNPCRQLECAWFMKIQGKNPQDGTDIDEWGCSMAWLPVLMIENSQQQRQTGAAVESFRNEMVKANEVGQRVLLAAAGVPQQAQQMILESK